MSYGLRADQQVIQMGILLGGLRMNVYVKRASPFVTSLLLVAGLTIVKIWLLPQSGFATPYVLYYSAVLVATIIGGLGCGLITALVAGFTATYFFTVPQSPFIILDWDQMIGLGVFTLESSFIAFIVHHALRREKSLRNEAAQSIITLENKTDELRQQAQLIKYFMEFSPVTIAMFDRNMRYLMASKSWRIEHKIGREDITGQSIYDVFPTSIPDHWREMHKRCLAGAVERCEKEAMILEDGSKIWTQWEVRPWRDDRGAIGGIVIWSMIISERVAAETALMEKQNELLVAKEAAEVASQTKSAFLANMSHEIRTPLGAVLGFSELLADPDLPATERLKYIDAAKRNGDLLSSIISDILDISKVEAGKMTTEKRRVSISEVIPDLTSTLSLKAQEKGLRLQLICDRNVPSTITTDPMRLRQILINLVGNAIKFTSKGTVDVTVTLLPHVNGHSRLAFVVTDTGPGISEDTAQKLFEPFAQGDPSIKRQFGGTGLGLVLSRSLANLLGGDVLLTKSEKEVGSTFTLTIDPGVVETIQPEATRAVPKAIEAYQLTDGSKPGATREWATCELSGLKILVVEDTIDIQLLIRLYLIGAGANVETASNGAEAIQMIAENSYDLVLMDLQMPVMDGYEATTTLRESGFRKPIVALTAHALADQRDRCLASGFNAHVIKPINRQTLISVIREVTSSELSQANAAKIGDVAPMSLQ
jgi:PAS domain S-box-containing protein